MQLKHDALIVAAALDGGCADLYSEDKRDGLEVTACTGSRVLVSDPFGAA
jgi:predicted nucleic acid-binding protein